MGIDRQGNPLPGATAAAAERFDRAVEAFNLYRGDPIALADEAIDAAPGCAMAHVLKGHLLATATEPAAVREAASIVDQLRSLSLGAREASHLSALEQIVAGNWTAAGLVLDRHNARFPHDLIALQVGHLVDFYRANARNLRDRIARALAEWGPERPGYSFVLGMYAFGLEETGDYAQAEEMGRRALDLEPYDSWAHHAVAHVMEMQGRAEDGLGWMIAREPYWSAEDNFFQVHNWWHRALFHLDLEQVERVLELYDTRIRRTPSPVVLDLIDASALLWRLQLGGSDVGERWHELADTWDRHADGRTYPFNDWHAAMAYLGAGRSGDVDRLLAQYRDDNSGTEVSAWARQTAVPLIEGFAAFHAGDYPTAADRLFGARHIANTFGGSHAQRDVIDWTLTEAAVRGGLDDLARALAGERLALKPHSTRNRRLVQRVAA
jgi:tetratricopeptide (TPR) repeat protein